MELLYPLMELSLAGTFVPWHW